MVKRVIKKVLKVIIDILILAVLIIGFILITEFSPKNGEALKTVGKSTVKLNKNAELSILTYNIGHLISNESESLFIEGGSSTRSAQKQVVTDNLEAAKKIVEDENADITLLQEVDYKSRASYDVNEYVELSNDFNGVSMYAVEQDVFIPYPFPNLIGSVKTGISILSKYDGGGCRLNLPQTYEFPERIFAAKKCLQKMVIPIEGTNNNLVVINVDMEDYDDGSMRASQLEMLKEEMLLEYNKGNYVIAGGDFNMLFPKDEANEYESINYTITKIDSKVFSDDWNIVTDTSKKTFRLRNIPYNENESITATVDGFITTPNIEVKSVSVIDTGFKNTNHNPVKIKIKLK